MVYTWYKPHELYDRLRTPQEIEEYIRILDEELNAKRIEEGAK